MIREIDIYGVFVPPMLLWVTVALPIAAVARRLLSHFGAYRFVWHRSLFDLSLLVIVLGVVVEVLMHWPLR